MEQLPRQAVEFPPLFSRRGWVSVWRVWVGLGKSLSASMQHTEVDQGCPTVKSKCEDCEGLMWLLLPSSLQLQWQPFPLPPQLLHPNFFRSGTAAIPGAKGESKAVL